MKTRAALGLCLALCARPAPLAAEDWLAAFEPTSDAAPALQLFYPRAELPALVEPGSVLVARLQLTAAITPPPGVQQARSLAGYGAELRGDGLPLGAAADHRHRLRVLSIRADAGTSLVYRVRLRVPAFVAPGTYAIELTTPFGARAALRAVRVIAPGSLPLLAACPPAGAQELGTLPVDVWLCPGGGLLPDAPGSLGLVPAPALSPNVVHGVFALRVGRALWRFGSASGSPAFERELLGVSREEQRELVDGRAQSLPMLPTAAFAAPRFTRSASNLEVETEVDRRLALLLPAKRALPADALLYPATDLRLHAASSVLALLGVRAGARVRVALDAPAPAPLSALHASAAHAGQTTELRITGAPSDARVAYEWGDKAALSGPDLLARVEGPLAEPARALVMSRTAGAQLLRTRVQVEASRPPSCGVAEAPRPARSGLFARALLCSWLMLLKIRRRRGVGNRLRPHVRCELRHGAYTFSPPLLPSALLRAVRVRADHDSQHARRGHARES